MADLLVKLYGLPNVTPLAARLQRKGVLIRPAMAYEKSLVVDWVRSCFGDGWADECDVAFSNHPVSCLLAVMSGRIIGFACYECTRRNFFGPMGVLEEHRKQGVGSALFLSCLHAMAAMGYAYAVVGGAGSVSFYEKTADASVIPGSSPGVYRDRLENS